MPEVDGGWQSSLKGSETEARVQAIKPGGSTGQVLAKASDDDFSTEWTDQTGGGGSGEFLTFTPQDAATMPNLTLFVDVADNMLKYKDNTGALINIEQAVKDVEAAIPIPDGKLVPDGGAANQVLAKASATDGDTEWADAGSSVPDERLIPAGGTTDQVLAKASASDYDTKWADSDGGGGGDYVLELEFDVVTDADRTFARTDGTDNYVAGMFSVPNSFDLTKLELELELGAGDVSGLTFTARIYDDDGSLVPNTELASVTFSGADIPATRDYVPIIFSGVTLISGNLYHIVVDREGVVDGGNYAKLTYDSTADSAVARIHRSTDGAVWNYQAAGQVKCRMYSGSPASGRTYILDLDFETAPVWDDVLGSEDCTFAVDDTYCGQYDGEVHAGSFSAGVQGIYSNVHLTKNLSAEVSEFYVDFWMWVEASGPYVFLMTNLAGDVNVLRIYYVDNVFKIYSDLFSILETTFKPNNATWTHYRLYFKYGATDGIIRMWHSETVDDFDGVAPDYEWTDVAMSANTPAGALVLRGFGSGAATSYLKLVDNLLVWEPDGNE